MVVLSIAIGQDHMIRNSVHESFPKNYRLLKFEIQHFVHGYGVRMTDLILYRWAWQHPTITRHLAPGTTQGEVSTVKEKTPSKPREKKFAQGISATPGLITANTTTTDSLIPRVINPNSLPAPGARKSKKFRSKIVTDQSESRMASKLKVSPKRQRPKKPSLPQALGQLHHLLTCSTFCRWPLKLRFYHAETYKQWANAAKKTARALRVGMSLTFEECKGHRAPLEGQEMKGIWAIDVGYTSLKLQLEKSISILAGNRTSNETAPKCYICGEIIKEEGSPGIVCPGAKCNIATHMTCLSRKFLEQENNANAIIPLEGNCPACQIRCEWRTLMQNLSLRLYGEKEVEKIMRERRVRKGKQPSHEISQPPLSLLDILDEEAMQADHDDLEDSPQKEPPPWMDPDEWKMLSSNDEESGDQAEKEHDWRCISSFEVKPDEDQDRSLSPEHELLRHQGTQSSSPKSRFRPPPIASFFRSQPLGVSSSKHGQIEIADSEDELGSLSSD